MACCRCEAILEPLQMNEPPWSVEQSGYTLFHLGHGKTTADCGGHHVIVQVAECAFFASNLQQGTPAKSSCMWHSGATPISVALV